MSKIKIKKVKASVKRAAKILDKKSKGWEKSIDISELNLQDSDYCIIGHVFGSYYSEKKKVQKIVSKIEEIDDTVLGGGNYEQFCIGHYGTLLYKAFWIKEIEKRQKS